MGDLGHDLILGELLRFVLLKDKIGLESSLLAGLADGLHQFDGGFEGFVETGDESVAWSEELGGKELPGLFLAEGAARDVLRDAEFTFRFVAFVGGVGLLEIGSAAFGAGALKGRKGAGDGLVVMGSGFVHDILGKGRDLLHEGLAIELAVLHLAQLGFPVARHGGRGQGFDVHFLKKLDQAEPLAGDVEVATVAGEVFLPEEALDGGGAGGRGAETTFGHGFAQFLVINEFSGALHGGKEGGLSKSGGRIGFLFLQLDFLDDGIFPFVDGDEFVLPGGDPDATAVDGEPAGVGEDLAIGLKRVGGALHRLGGAGNAEGARLGVIDGGKAFGDLEFGVGEEDCDEAFDDHVVKFFLGFIDFDDATGRDNGEVV